MIYDATLDDAGRRGVTPAWVQRTGGGREGGGACVRVPSGRYFMHGSRTDVTKIFAPQKKIDI